MQPDQFDLARLLGSMEPKTFFHDFWEKQPLTLSRADPAYYDGLFTERDVDSLIAFTHPKIFDNLKPGSPPRLNVVRGWLPYEEQFAGSYPGLPDVQRAFASGKTILITSLEHRWPTVAAMGRHLETFFGCPVHTNLYLTPAGSQGFDPHYDTHEVFVLQIGGDKHWRLYGAGRDLPLPNEKSAITKDRLGAPTQDVGLQPGDLLYLPRGHVHEAFTSDRASLHLTVGVNVYRWLDLLQQALAEAGAADVRFRQSLPLGLLCADLPSPSLKRKFQELLRLLGDRADLENAVESMAAAFVGSRTALPQDYFAIDQPDRISLDTLLERAAGTVCRVVQKGDTVTLHAPGACIDGPAKIAPALHFIACTQQFTPAALPDDLMPDAKLALVRRLVREKLLTIVSQANGTGEPSTTRRDGR
jgi:ribosomal protein L16 Arg81 hydroxylase